MSGAFSLPRTPTTPAAAAGITAPDVGASAAGDEQSAPPPAGLISEPIGSFASSQPGSVVFPSTVGDTLDWFGTTRQIGRGLRNLAAEFGSADEFGHPVMAPEPAIPAADLQKQFGIPGKLTFDAPLPESVAQSMYQAKREEIAREDALARRPSGFLSGAATVGADLLAGMLDPTNIAASFVPAVGEARIGALFGESALGQVAARAATGAISGVTGQVPVVALRYGLSKEEQADYDAYSAMSDLALGAGIGGVLHPLIGAAGDFLSARFNRSPAARIIQQDPETRLAALETAVAQMVDDRPVDVQPVLDAAPPIDLGRPATLSDIERLSALEDTAANPAVSDLLDQIKAAGRMKPQGEQSLVSWLVANGGVQDSDGEIANLIGGNRVRPGLINRNGMPADIAAMRARDAGYFPEHPNVDYRPDTLDTNALHEAISDELNQGVRRFADTEDVATRHLAEQADQLDRILSEHGLSINSPKSEILAALREANPEWRHQTLQAADAGEEQGNGAFLGRDWIRRHGITADGRYDMTAGARAMTDAVQSALDRGDAVTLVTDQGQKRVPITAIDNGMMQDATGQRWGTLSISSDGTGREGVEIIPQREADPQAQLSAEAARAGLDGATQAVTKQPSLEAMQVQRRAAEAATMKPDAMLAQAVKDAADHEEFLARADAAGGLSEADRAELADIANLEPQALSLGQAFMQAAACIGRGLIGA